ncbi:MAG: branched-chain amino acid ABC transporter permease [Candidatus Hodarchaeota archaeon]
MKNLSKVIQEDFFEEQKWTILGLIILFTFFLVFPFLTQEKSSQALQIIILGAVTSSLYAVLALGFSLIYGVAKQLKLSLGGYYVVGAYSMYFLLETVKINPRISLLNNIDGIFLLGLVALPIILIIGLLIFFWLELKIKEFSVLLISVLVAGVSILLFYGFGAIVQCFYTSLAVLVISLAAWYLELPKREIVLGTLVVGLIIFIFGLLDLPAAYITLMVLAIMFTALLALLTDKFVLKRFRASHVNTMIVTFSMALLLQSVIQIFLYPEGGKQLEQFGPEDRTLQPVLPRENVAFLIDFFEVFVDNVRILSLISSITVCVILYLFIWKTKMGVALRAVSQDEEAAALAGIDIRKSTAIVSGIGMGLIAFASILTSPFAAMPIWSPFMGWWVLIMSIAVVTLGGMGSLPGSIIAAFIIGYAEVLISSIPEFAPFSVVLPFIVVLLVMIFKPEGLLGEKKELEG